MKPFFVSMGLRLNSLAGAASAQPLEKVHDFSGPMMTGVTVSHAGRIFVCYPHWGNPIEFTGGREIAYPNAQINWSGRGRSTTARTSAESLTRCTGCGSARSLCC